MRGSTGVRTVVRGARGAAPAGRRTLYWRAMRSPWPLILLLAAACDGVQGPPPPASEFLVAAGDSTFWITTGAKGTTVRGAPIALARLEGRLYELYVTDDDRSYYDAVMVGQRLYRRDLITGDSAVVIEDTTVARLARAYAAGHPGERRLEPHEDASDDPDVFATADLEIVAVHGPYLSFEHHSDIGLPDGSEIHSIRRGVVDLRTRAATQVEDLFGPAEATRVIGEARRTFADGVDSLLASSDPRAEELGTVVRELRFDPASFSIGRIGNEPTVAFLVPGEGDWAVDLAFPMSPIRVAPPPWWAEIRPTLPTSPDSTLDEVWDRPGASPGVVGRHDTAQRIVTLVLRDSADREWKAARVPPPVEWILWLDAPPLDSASRRGLRRAFDEASLYSDDARIVTLPSRPGIRHASHTSVAVRRYRSRGVSRLAPQRLPLHPRRAPATVATSPAPGFLPAALRAPALDRNQ